MTLQHLYDNPLMMTDCYNLSHEDFKINTDWEVSYIYNRSSPMVLYGLQELVNRIFRQNITMDMIEEAEGYAKQMNLWFPRDLFEKVVALGGKFPLKIRAMNEGSWIPQGTPFCEVSNTVLNFGELVTWWEARLLKAWFPSACATRAFHMKNYLVKNDYPLNKFHSFGYRSHRSEEDAYWCGTAWNLFLQGTDDFHTVRHDAQVITGSIPALAHKVVQQFDFELEAYFRAIWATKDRGLKAVALVIDTFDPWNFIENMSEAVVKYGQELGVHLVFRPDSGNVFEQAETLLRMYDKQDVSVIIGEGMTFDKAKIYDQQLRTDGVDPTRIHYGIGGGFHNDLTRETLGWAMKTAYSNNGDRMKFSMDRGKVSLPGYLDVVKDNNVLKVIPTEKDYFNDNSQYHTLYNHDGTTWLSWTKPIRDELWKLDPDNLQSFIIISDELQLKINQFRERYLRMV